MANSTNVVSRSSFLGSSDTLRHGFTLARRETEEEKIHRHISWRNEAKSLVSNWESHRKDK